MHSKEASTVTLVEEDGNLHQNNGSEGGEKQKDLKDNTCMGKTNKPGGGIVRTELGAS